MQLFSLFKEKIKLHSQKYHLIDKIDRLGMNQLYLKELKGLLKKEKEMNKSLKKEVEILSRFTNLSLVEEQLDNVNQTTNKQLEILNRIRLRIFRQANYERFREECRKEAEQSKFLSNILKETITAKIEVPEEELRKEKILLDQIQKKYKELINSVGDVKKVQQKAKELLLIHRQLKKTQLYGFVKYDVDFIIGKSMYVMKHPKESKLKFILATAYIIAPLTFEMTGVYLFFRYLNKYIKGIKPEDKN